MLIKPIIFKSTLAAAASLVAVSVGVPASGVTDSDDGHPSEWNASPPVNPDSQDDDDDWLASKMSQFKDFGGAYFDSQGDGIVLSTEGNAARTRYERNPPPGFDEVSAQGRLEVLPAKFSFFQLNAWKDVIRDRVGELPGLTFLDLDDRRNRIVIGAEAPEKVRRSLSEVMHSSNIPSVEVEVVQFDGMAQSATLRDRYRPILGGLQIDWLTPGGAHYLCTLGLPVIFAADHPSDARSFGLTNSHCSGTQGGNQGTEFYQGPSMLFTDYVGVEYRDPAYSTASPCPSGKRCRWSDAALFIFEGLLDAEISIGSVARTLEKSDQGGTLASRTIVGEDDLDYVSPYTLYDGDKVSKVGRTTGYTSGPITRRCVDYTVTDTNVYLYCQYQVRMNSAGGDSGAAVVKSTTMVGLHWGGSTISGVHHTAFSPTSGIERELGDLTVLGVD